MVLFFRSIGLKDPHVNRLEDSLLLWKSIVSNKLLCNVNIILFLNKCDLLQVCPRLQSPFIAVLTSRQAKLDAGVRLNQHMVSYGDRPNDYDSISDRLLHLHSEFRNIYIWRPSSAVHAKRRAGEIIQYDRRLPFMKTDPDLLCSSPHLGHRYLADPYDNFQR